MGAFLEKPKTDKTSKKGEACGLRYGASAMQGWRMEMEDADVCETELEISNSCFFGVFDGHAGSKVSQYCSENLWRNVMCCLSGGHTVDNIKDAMYNGFLRLDDKLKENPIWAKGEDHSGSTAIVVFISPTHIIWANCGDSRSVFCKNCQLCFATDDHKPSNSQEKDRIEKAGGTVMMQRVNGTLAVSRALGDFDYKRGIDLKSTEQLVSPEPDLNVIERNLGEDEFVVLACDGIYDVMTNDEVIDFVRHRLELESDLTKICNDLIDTCLHKNSRDNMSVIIVTFPAAPKVTEEAIEKEKEMQMKFTKEIKLRIEDIVKSANDPLDVEESYVFEQLLKEMPTNHDVVMKKQFIFEQLKKCTDEKFAGNLIGGDFTGTSDPNDAPAEMQFNTTDGTHFQIKRVMGDREEDSDLSEFHSYDEHLLKLEPGPEETNSDKMATSLDGEEEQMEVTTQEEDIKPGEDSSQENISSSVAST